jgi:transglutaminase-like putative cysteine protease
MQLKISHATDYHYDQSVYYALQRLRLSPKNGPCQTVREWHTKVEGATAEVAYDDHFGNGVQLLSTDIGATVIRIVAEGVIETTCHDGVAGPHAGFAPLWLFQRDTPLTKAGRHVRDLARSVTGSDPLARLHGLMKSVSDAVAYRVGATDAASTAEEAIAAGAGVCQDHAHVFLAAARHLCFPARYVSGYLLMDDRTQQEATHAWAEAHVEGLGWVGFDASNCISPDERYVRLAHGLDYGDAAPVSGIRLGNSSESLAVAITVEQ